MIILNAQQKSIVLTEIAYTQVMREEFRGWLTRHMEGRNWGNKQVAKIANVTPSAVSRWILGRSRPDPDRLLLLAEATGEDPHYLLHIVYGVPLPDDSQEINPRLREIMQALEYISDEGLDFLADQVRYVLRKKFPRE